MSNDFGLKKYFIKDMELTSIDEDMLDYNEITENIERVIEGTEPSYNIALTGESGAGKSSVVNFLVDKYKKYPERYNIQRFNCWKSDISLKEYLESKYVKNNIDVSTNINDNIEKNNTIVEDSNSNNKNKEKKLSKPVKVILGICNIILTFVACFFITSIIYVVMEYLSNRSIYTNDIFFVENTYINYSENIGIIMLLSILLSSLGIVIYNLVKHGKKNPKESKNNLVDNSDVITENIITNKTEEVIIPNIEENDLVNIVVIEDIDKLSVGKMLKMLEDIKFCNDFKKCVCIIPIDKKMLQKAIDVRNKVKLNSNYKPLKFEKVFDKIFQFKFNMPQITTKRFVDYAVELVENEIPDFMEEYCNKESFENVIKKVLIYKNVSTPRHVKKLINNFANNKILAITRFENGEIDEELVYSENFDYELAKISVIQSDFGDFYDVLFRDYNNLDKLTDLYQMNIEDIKENFEKIDDDLKPFLYAKYRPLRNFLIQTKDCKINDLAIVMYLTQNGTEKLYKGRPISSYIDNSSAINSLSYEEIKELVDIIDNDDNVDVTGKTILDILSKVKQGLNTKNFDERFDFIKQHNDAFFEEDGNVSAYVEFLIDNIGLSSEPNEIIAELDENFTRIGKVYELNKKIKGLENLNQETAYSFMAKCLDNGDLDRMVSVINDILSDENSVQDCLNIEKYLKNYNMIDVIECDVDDIILEEEAKLGINDNDEKEVENDVKKIGSNYTLVKNLLEICVVKSDKLDPTDVMKIAERTLSNEKNAMYVLNIFSTLKKLDRMYFYEIRRDFNKVIYKVYHNTKNNAVKEAALECTRYFRNTRLFRAMLNEEELKFYSEN